MGNDGFSPLLSLIVVFLVLKENGQIIGNTLLSHHQMYAILFYFTWLLLSCSTKLCAAKEESLYLNNRILNFKAKLRDWPFVAECQLFAQIKADT